MNTTTGQPVKPAPHSGVLRIGDHVHQFLNLVHALSTNSADSAGTQSTTGDLSSAANVGVDLSGLSDAACARWSQDLEELLRSGQALAVQAAGEIDQRVTAGRYAETGARGAVALLVQSLQLSAAEASRRIRLAKAVLPLRDTITGISVPTANPVLATAFFKGSVSQERALTVSKYLDEAARLASNGRIDQEQAAEVEETLVLTAEQQGPDFIRSVGNRIMSHLDPDGHKPSQSDLLAKQGLFFRQPRRGLVSLYGACTIEQYEQLMALISFATNPNKHTDIDTLAATETGAGRSAGGTDGSSEGPPPDTGTGTGTGTEDDSGLGASNHSEGDSQQCEGQESLLDQLHGLSDLLTTTDNTPDPDYGQPASEPLAPPDPEPEPEPENPQPPRPPEPNPPQAPEPLQPAESKPPAPPTKPALSKPPLFNGWSRRLEPWEIPPRPPQAPENASPPVFEGDNWFWFDTGPQTKPERPESEHADLTGQTEQPHQTEKPQAEYGGPESAPEWDNNLGSKGENTPGWGTSNEDDSLRDWPHLVYGVDVAAPGSNEPLPGLDPIDPLSTEPAVKDTRTHGQKLLDGMISCVKLAARTGQLPLNGGLKTQLIISCTEEDLNRSDGLGTAYTTFSGPMPLGLFSQSLCDPDITTLTYGTGQEIINAGRTRRLFTPAQRKLLFARDLGCSFPDCTASAMWCEAHHVIPWREGGETNLNNAALLCQHHHTLVHHSQWQVHIINGTPWFTPPWVVDPTQTKLRNNFHHGLTKTTLATN
ncbi:HNH endonuclease signature motif containing protein [Arthrobacter sp. Sr24]